MSMTHFEVEERAHQIWGCKPNKVHLRPDGGADLDYGYVEYPPYGYHRLDANGHVSCHVVCQEAEKSGLHLHLK